MNIEYNAEASGPFLLPRVEESFDYYAAQRAYHDTMFASCHDDSSSAVLSRILRVTGQQTEKRSSHAAFVVASPQAIVDNVVRSFEQVAPPNFRRPLDRSLMFTHELFGGTRGCISVVAMEGHQRFHRPWSQKRWARELRRHGFVTPPWARAVGSQVCQLMLPGLPDAVQVATTEEGLAFAFCGKDDIYATLWAAAGGCTRA